MTKDFPDAAQPNPIILPNGETHPGTVFLNRVVTHTNWHIGDYTYASDFDPPADWASHLAPYLFESGREHIHIGKFCQIAHGVRFITAGANHAQDGLTTFPFPIFNPDQIGTYQPDSRDTTIGHDVWIGAGAIICPGASIGCGVIIGAGSVVRGHIPDYAVVTGNPATITRMRFDTETIDRMMGLAWWHWPTTNIAKARNALLSGDLSELEKHQP